MDPIQIRTRIAPSPTGDAHIGTIYQALVDYAIAKQHSGQFILRVEDTDRTRLVEGAMENVLGYLEWVGLIPDEDFKRGGPVGPYIQSERLALYHEHAQKLLEKGDAYYCFCTAERLDAVRSEQQKNKEQPKYDRHCRYVDPKEALKRVEKGEKHVIRMKIPDNETISFLDLSRGEISFDANQVDDQVIVKSDGFPTYHLAVVVDDHFMRITHVVRGEEWISSTPKHILLYRYFGWEVPVFLHTQVIRNADKSKLSKRKGDVSVGSFKAKGYLPEALINFLGILICPNAENKEVFDLPYFVENFSFDRVSKTGPVFDMQKLDWLNGMYLRAMPLATLADRIREYISLPLDTKSEAYFLSALCLIQERIKRLDEADELLDLFYTRPTIDLNEKKETIQMLYNLTETYLDNENILEEKIREEATKNGKKAGEYFMLLRDAITGKKATPPLIPLMKVLGLEESLTRIKQSIGE